MTNNLPHPDHAGQRLKSIQLGIQIIRGEVDKSHLFQQPVGIGVSNGLYPTCLSQAVFRPDLNMPRGRDPNSRGLIAEFLDEVVTLNGCSVAKRRSTPRAISHG